MPRSRPQELAGTSAGVFLSVSPTTWHTKWSPIRFEFWPWPMSSDAQITGFAATELLFRPQQREQNHISDRWRVGQKHHEAVDAQAKAAGGWHAVLEGGDEVVIH